jgi:hypothetical protein
MSEAIRFTGQLEGDDHTEAITQEALSMMREAGVFVGEFDPEAKNVDFSSPYKFLKSMEAAITAKQSRVGSQARTQPGCAYTANFLGCFWWSNVVCRIVDGQVDRASERSRKEHS